MRPSLLKKPTIPLIRQDFRCSKLSPSREASPLIRLLDHYRRVALYKRETIAQYNMADIMLKQCYCIIVMTFEGKIKLNVETY